MLTFEQFICLINMMKAAASGPPYARPLTQKEIEDHKDDHEDRVEQGKEPL